MDINNFSLKMQWLKFKHTCNGNFGNIPEREFQKKAFAHLRPHKPTQEHISAKEKHINSNIIFLTKAKPIELPKDHIPCLDKLIDRHVIVEYEEELSLDAQEPERSLVEMEAKEAYQRLDENFKKKHGYLLNRTSDAN